MSSPLCPSLPSPLLWPPRDKRDEGPGWLPWTDSRGACRHKYQQLPLIPVDEFLALHPEHAAADEDALMAARIEHERVERETLEQQRQELLKRKQKLIADNKKRKDDLANLDKDLEKFIDVGCPPRARGGRSLGRCANDGAVGGETDSEALREGGLRWRTGPVYDASPSMIIHVKI